jgi:hypothetical protein
VTDDIDDDPIGVLHEKTANAPWLVGHGIHDRVSKPPCGFMTGVDISDFDADIGMGFVSGVGGDNAELIPPPFQIDLAM